MPVYTVCLSYTVGSFIEIFSFTYYVSLYKMLFSPAGTYLLRNMGVRKRKVSYEKRRKKEEERKQHFYVSLLFLICTRPKGVVCIRTKVSNAGAVLWLAQKLEKIRNLRNGTAQLFVESNCLENGREIRLSWKSEWVRKRIHWF